MRYLIDEGRAARLFRDMLLDGCSTELRREEEGKRTGAELNQTLFDKEGR